MPTPAPVQFTTADGSLAGAVNGSNTAYSFVPLTRLLLYTPLPDQDGSLVFRDGLLITEYVDYIAGDGWFLLTTPLI